MGDSLLRRFWNAIKPPPPTPRRAWDVEPPSQRRRFWEFLKPPSPLDAVPPEVQRRRRWIRTYVVLTLAIAALVVGVGSYIRSAPQRAETALQTGIQLAAAGDASLAADSFTRAIRIWPRSADAYLQRRLARQNLLHPDAALQDFDQALRLNPRLAAANVARGAIFRDRGDAQRALAEFSAAVAIEPGVDAYYQRGQVYESLGRPEEAIRDYSAAIAVLPSSPYVYRARAAAEVNSGDRDKAARDREHADGIESNAAELRP
jgi:tetratricopeptide (TPR) repeat protein